MNASIAGTPHCQQLRLRQPAKLRRTSVTLLAVVHTLLAAHAAAQDDQIVATALAASDWFYHGTTETDNAPVTAFNVEWQGQQGFFLGTQGHYAREDASSRQREQGVMFYGGYSQPLPRGWNASISVAQRNFYDNQKDWDFTEYAVDLQHELGFGVRYDHSPDYYSHRARSHALELRYLRPFGNFWYGQISAGRLELSNPNWEDHHWAQLAIGRSLGRWNIEGFAHWNNQGSDRSFGQLEYSDPGVAARLAFRLW